MSKKFSDELKEFKKDVYEMGRFSHIMLEDAVKSTLKNDQELAKSVISKKEKIKIYDYELESKALHMLTLYTPVAKDMRTLASMLKVITYLTRIGRYAKDIANIEIDLFDEERIKYVGNIPKISELTLSMLDDALTDIEKEDLKLIENFAERDDEIDKLRHESFQKSVEYMKGDPNGINECSNYLMVTRYLERCADHACKIAEKTHYIVTGERKVIR